VKPKYQNKNVSKINAKMTELYAEKSALKAQLHNIKGAAPPLAPLPSVVASSSILPSTMPPLIASRPPSPSLVIPDSLLQEDERHAPPLAHDLTLLPLKTPSVNLTAEMAPKVELLHVSSPDQDGISLRRSIRIHCKTTMPRKEERRMLAQSTSTSSCTSSSTSSHSICPFTPLTVNEVSIMIGDWGMSFISNQTFNDEIDNFVYEHKLSFYARFEQFLFNVVTSYYFAGPAIKWGDFLGC
jgi:hypothetical protein